MGDALINVGKQKFRSGMNIGDRINNLVKGVSAAARLAAMKNVDTEPESVRATRSQAKSAANFRRGAQRRTLEAQLNRQNLNRQWRGRGGGGGGAFGGSMIQTIDTPSNPGNYGSINDASRRRAERKFRGGV